MSAPHTLSPPDLPRQRRQRARIHTRRAVTADAIARRTLSARERMALGAAGVIVVLAIWQVLSEAHVIDPLVASSPSEIAKAAWKLITDGTLWPAVLSSARLFAIGFGVSLIIGLALGVVLGWYRRVEAVIDPWISILYATPRIALIPLFLVWTGIGLTTQVLIVITVAVFPIVINVAAGVSAIDRDHLLVARSFLATDADVLRTVALPGAMPLVISGIRQGISQALIGVVVAEYFVGNTGVGGLIFNAGQTLDTADAFVGAIVFALAALVLTGLLRRVERRLEDWR